MQFIVVLSIACVAGILPMLGYLAFIYWLDRYEREPWWMVALTFIWGAVGGAGFGCCINTAVISGVGAFMGPEAADWIGPVIVAPLVEETTKIIPLFGLLLLRHLDNPTDGLIYGAATGLGFAMLENISYFYNVGSSAGLGAMFMNIVVRTCFTALVHCAASASFGFILGVFRYRHWLIKWLLAPPLGYGIAIAIHAAWNGSATYSSWKGSFAVQAGACAVVLGLGAFMFFLTQMSLYLEHRTIKWQLADEVQHGIFPAAHAAIVPYWLKRRRYGWLAPHIDQERYVKAATLLAFRKHQVEHATGPTQAGLEEDVRRYRAEIKMLLTADAAWPHQASAAGPSAPSPPPNQWPQDRGGSGGNWQQ